MSEYDFGITRTCPTRAQAARRDEICRQHGGAGYVEHNVRPGARPHINDGRYLAWYVKSVSQGFPADDRFAETVLAQVEREEKA